MNRLLGACLILSISTLTTACKLAVIVVEGGEVLSDRSGTCAAGSVCVTKVEDTSFHDSYESIAHEGWYFESWQSGDRFLCGGSIDPSCDLSFSGIEGKVEGMVMSSETFYLMPIFKPTESNSISVDGKSVTAAQRIWLQPVDFVQYSFEQLSQVCSGEGPCTGMLPGSPIDLTGYVWASSADIRLLFQAYRKADRAIVGDFTQTWDAEFPGGTAPSIVAVTSDQFEVVIIGDQPGGGGEFYPLEDSPGFTSNRGVWFWRHLQ